MSRSKDNKSRLVGCLAIIAVIIAISGCATWQRRYHGVLMKGSIIEIQDSDIYLCIGKRDGASVGQDLNVYKMVATSTNPKVPMFRREYTGKVNLSNAKQLHLINSSGGLLKGV